MIIEKLHYEIRRRWLGNSNNHRPGLTDLEIDQLLGDAAQIYFNQFAHGHSYKTFKFSAGQNQQRMDMLRTLMSEANLSPTRIEGEAHYFTLPDDYGSYQTATVQTEDCAFTYKVTLKKHGHRSAIINDHHQKASKAFQYCPAFLRNDELEVWLPVDSGYPSMKLIYFRTPAQPRLGTYDDIDGSPLPKSELDIPDRYHHILLDIAIAELDRIYGDGNKLQFDQQKIIEQS